MITSSISSFITAILCMLLNFGTLVSLFAQPDDPGEWRQLFNGKDLAGWKHVGDGYMTVEEGLIQSHGGMGLLYWTGEKFGNCTIRIIWRMRDENSNAGFFIRIPIEPREAWMPVFYSYEVQIDNHPELSDEDEYHSTGMLYAFTKPLAIAWKPGPEYLRDHPGWRSYHCYVEWSESD